MELVAHQEAALQRLVAHLQVPRTAAECFPALYGRRIGPGEYGLALVEAVGHLNHLRRMGLAAGEPGTDGAWRWRAT
jgi:hypothetical protein